MSVGTDQLVLELTPLQDRVDYVLRWIRQDGDVLELPNRVHVSWQPANLGGVRASLRCSVPDCGRPCRRLFLWNTHLACRRCANVRYPSQVAPQPPHVKSVARAKEIRARLGGESELGSPHPPRPKGMHRRTYERLVAELAEIERVEENRAIDAGELSLQEVIALTLLRRRAARGTSQETTSP